MYFKGPRGGIRLASITAMILLHTGGAGSPDVSFTLITRGSPEVKPHTRRPPFFSPFYVVTASNSKERVIRSNPFQTALSFLCSQPRVYPNVSNFSILSNQHFHFQTVLSLFCDGSTTWVRSSSVLSCLFCDSGSSDQPQATVRVLGVSTHLRKKLTTWQRPNSRLQRM